MRILDGSVRFEHLREAVGIGVTRPRVSWVVEAEAQGWRRAAYEMEAADESGAVAWSTGRVASDESVLVPWGGASLRSRERVSVRARVWGADASESDWSAPAVVEAGLLEAGDWSARFVTPDWDEDIEVMQPSPLIRREFAVRGGAVRARLYASALGLYEAEINGSRVGDHVLAPGWTSYDHRLRYQTFDVLAMLREGPNCIGAMLGEGWYRGRLGFPQAGGRNIYGDRMALLAQLEITYADGTTDVIATAADGTWRATRGPIVSSGIYEGEAYDARQEIAGWSMAGFDDGAWSGVREVARDMGTLVAPTGPPVRRQEELTPREIITSPSGKTIVDFGQNMTGRLRIRVQGPAGTTVTLRHAELLEDGELCTRTLRSAQATDTYTLLGDGVETWEARFTFHGFRYAQVDGWPGELSADAIRAVVCHSDMERTGWFECSDPMINRLHENSVWSMKSNFLDVPTDCPQRDERLGWTGDLTVFSPSACYLHDAAGFLESWLADVRADQTEDGVVPIVVPNLFGRGDWPQAGLFKGVAQAVWGDAGVVVPWVVYERYGDAGVLETQYESMRRWVECVAGLAGPSRLWDKGFQFADWLDPSAPRDQPQRAMTDPHLVATAYFSRVAELLSRTAGVLGREDDRARYAALAEEVRAAFRRENVTPNGRLASDSQTAYALGLLFGLVEGEEPRRRAARRLVSLARLNGFKVGTGFVGTAIVLDALCEAGEVDAAFAMLTERGCPSWLYPVTMGATTIWERWDSQLPDGRVNPGDMTSFNHYALGAVADWLHRTVGGLAPLEPGYRRIEVRPRIGGGITSATARLRTPSGEASSSWRLEGGRMELEVVVPA
ncbi:MAG: family 78 glycoside hydrolase catalytic domain, partial [Chloroflexi bacterium]|nr:family 78 glycoside hydrolase catalytic domain [Chloroflexota bacterium]